MDVMGDRFSKDVIFIPEVPVDSWAMRQAIDMLELARVKEDVRRAGDFRSNEYGEYQGPKL